ncbi:MerR family transcriptional regulator [Granulicoccus phenolivorans]|uniref:MerR family transcriptional regulator n=1 Tax=Granulicoccus phenolivorans TaxID=266854 RepID=UPI00041B9C8F|nr:MerR family transcriptional regulator [Granulicoccus phenolivorans]
MNHPETGRTLAVGDLAAAAGLTVRTLHYYEEIGLLHPSLRTSAGHRRYGPDAVARLYRLTRLRSLGLGLDQIRRILDDPAAGLVEALRQHAHAVDERVAALTRLRTGVATTLARIEANHDPTADLLEVLTTMETLENPLKKRIGILVYRDLAAAHDYLVETFGLLPGEVVLDPAGTAVHAYLYAGDGVIWLHPESDTYQLKSPLTLGAASATTAVLVDDVDAHYAMVRAHGGDIVYEPTDQPYGYREYSARDCEGALWSFMKELTP